MKSSQEPLGHFQPKWLENIVGVWGFI